MLDPLSKRQVRALWFPRVLIRPLKDMLQSADVNIMSSLQILRCIDVKKLLEINVLTHGDRC